jgi:hypothetical protein
VERRDEKVKVYNFEVEGFHTYFVSDLGILVHNTCLMQPDPMATAQHTVIKIDPQTGRIRNYETFTPQTNPRNPNPWESVQRVDLQGAEHYNKVTKEYVPTPNVNSRNIPGGVRPAELREIPGDLPRP